MRLPAAAALPGSTRLTSVRRGGARTVLVGVVAVLGAGMFAGGSAGATTCSIVWDGGAAVDQWNEPANWDLGRVPGVGDEVCIPDMQDDVTITHSTGWTTVDSVDTSEDLTLSGGTLNVASVVAHPGASVWVPGGVLQATGVAATGGSFAVTGGTAIVASLTATDSGQLSLTTGVLNAISIRAASDTPMALNGGTLGGGPTLASGVFTLPSTGSEPDTSGWTVGPDAVLDLTSAGAYSVYRPLINQGTIDLGSASTVTDGSGFGTLANTATGEMVKDVAGHTTTLSLPFDNTGTIAVRSGAVQLPGGMTSGDSPAFDTVTGTFSGGSYVVGDAAILRFNASMAIQTNHATFDLAGTGTVLDSGNLSVFRNLGTNSGDLILRDGGGLVTLNALTNTGSIIVGSDSVLTAAGSYTQSGADSLTRLNDETANDSTARLATQNATFNAGRLEGNGTLEGSLVNNGAVISPGDSQGTMTVTGNLTQNAGTLQMEVFGRTAGTFDVIAVGGAAVLNGGLELITEAFTPAWDDAFTMVEAATPPTIAFTSVTGQSLPSGMSYEVLQIDGGMRLDVVDSVAPTNVSPTSKHATSTWSKDNTVKVALAGANDEHSGVDGYAVVWSNDPTTQPAPIKTVEETATTITSPTLASKDSHYVHIRTKDNEGHWSGTTHLGPFWIDRTLPTGGPLSLPMTTVSYSPLANAAGPQVKVAWSPAVDGHSGMAGHTVVYRTTANGTLWTSAKKTLGAAASTWKLTGKAGRTYCFKVRHTDAVRNAKTTPQRCVAVPYDDAVFTPAKTWTQKTSKAYYLGSASKSTGTNATLTRKGVTAKRISLVATKCAGCGSVQVYFRGVAVGKVIKLNTTAPKPLHRQVISVAKLSSVQRGALVVKVVSTGGKPVFIDGVGASLR